MVQHNATKFVTNCYPKKGDFTEFSVTKLLNELKWDSLEERRVQARLSMAFKIINDLVILESNMLPKLNYQRPVRQCSTARVGPGNELVESYSRLQVTGNTFFFSIPKLWNDRITTSQAKSASIEQFKHKFQKK